MYCIKDPQIQLLGCGENEVELKSNSWFSIEVNKCYDNNTKNFCSDDNSIINWLKYKKLLIKTL